MSCAECSRLRADALDAAALRKAFHVACEAAFHVGKVAVSKHPSKAEAAWMEVWEDLYEAVRDTTAGLRVLAELARLREQNLELCSRLALLAAPAPGPWFVTWEVNYQ